MKWFYRLQEMYLSCLGTILITFFSIVIIAYFIDEEALEKINNRLHSGNRLPEEVDK